MTPDIEDMQRLANWYAWRAECAAAEAKHLVAEERKRAIIDALALYAGELWTRASALSDDYIAYLGNGWRRERELKCLPESASPRRRSFHRIARSRSGKELKARRIFDVARDCNFSSSTLQSPPCESSSQANESD